MGWPGQVQSQWDLARPVNKSEYFRLRMLLLPPALYGRADQPNFHLRAGVYSVRTACSKLLLVYSICRLSWPDV